MWGPTEEIGMEWEDEMEIWGSNRNGKTKWNLGSNRNLKTKWNLDSNRNLKTKWNLDSNRNLKRGI